MKNLWECFSPLLNSAHSPLRVRSFWLCIVSQPRPNPERQWWQPQLGPGDLRKELDQDICSDKVRNARTIRTRISNRISYIFIVLPLKARHFYFSELRCHSAGKELEPATSARSFSWLKHVETAAHLLCMLGTLQDQRFFWNCGAENLSWRGGRQGSHDSAGKHALPNAEGPSFQIIAIEWRDYITPSTQRRCLKQCFTVICFSSKSDAWSSSQA